MHPIGGLCLCGARIGGRFLCRSFGRRHFSRCCLIGCGFDWRRFLDFDPERAFAPNGRGIALSRQLSFSSLTYIPPGNRVVVTVPRDETSK